MSDLEPEDIPVEGDDVPDVEPVLDGYVPPDADRLYPRSGDRDDEDDRADG